MVRGGAVGGDDDGGESETDGGCGGTRRESANVGETWSAKDGGGGCGGDGGEVAGRGGGCRGGRGDGSGLVTPFCSDSATGWTRARSGDGGPDADDSDSVSEGDVLSCDKDGGGGGARPSAPSTPACARGSPLGGGAARRRPTGATACSRGG